MPTLAAPTDTPTELITDTPRLPGLIDPSWSDTPAAPLAADEDLDEDEAYFLGEEDDDDDDDDSDYDDDFDEFDDEDDEDVDTDFEDDDDDL